MCGAIIAPRLVRSSRRVSRSASSVSGSAEEPRRATASAGAQAQARLAAELKDAWTARSELPATAMLSDALQFARKASSNKLTPSTNYRANRRPSGGELRRRSRLCVGRTPLGEVSASNLMARIDPQQFDRSSLTTPRTSSLTGGDVLAPPPHCAAAAPLAVLPGRAAARCRAHAPTARGARCRRRRRRQQSRRSAKPLGGARRAAALARLTRIVHQATGLQRWISTPAAVAAPLAQAEGLIERLEAAESALASLQSLLAGESGQPNRCRRSSGRSTRNALDGARARRSARRTCTCSSATCRRRSPRPPRRRQAARVDADALAGVPPAADAAIEQAEAALAGRAVGAAQRAPAARQPPAARHARPGRGGRRRGADLRRRGGARRGAASAAPTFGRRAGGPPTPTPGSTCSHAGCRRRCGRRRRARRRRGRPAQLSRKLSFTGDAPAAGRQTPSPPMPSS